MHEDGVCSYRLDLQFMSKSGMLDYLKQSEHDHLNAFLLALKLFELKQIRLKGLRICDGLFIVETVILDDFISWLWSQVVLDMNPIDVSSCSFTFSEALEPTYILLNLRARTVNSSEELPQEVEYCRDWLHWSKMTYLANVLH
jgi:hypothetical protein